MAKCWNCGHDETVVEEAVMSLYNVVQERCPLCDDVRATEIHVTKAAGVAAGDLWITGGGNMIVREVRFVEGKVKFRLSAGRTDFGVWTIPLPPDHTMTNVRRFL